MRSSVARATAGGNQLPSWTAPPGDTRGTRRRTPRRGRQPVRAVVRAGWSACRRSVSEPSWRTSDRGYRAARSDPPRCRPAVLRAVHRHRPEAQIAERRQVARPERQPVPLSPASGLILGVEMGEEVHRLVGHQRPDLSPGPRRERMCGPGTPASGSGRSIRGGTARRTVERRPRLRVG